MTTHHPPYDPPCTEDLAEVPPGTTIPNMGKVYAPARVNRARAVEIGLAELRAWLAEHPDAAPGWLLRASRRAKGLSSLATLMGTRRRGDAVEVDQELAAARAQDMQESEDQPAMVRQLWGELARLLAKRGAAPNGPTAPCVACGGTRKNSKGGPCVPCATRARQRKELRAAAPTCSACGGTKWSQGGPCRACAPRQKQEPWWKQQKREARKARQLARDPLVRDTARILEAELEAPPAKKKAKAKGFSAYSKTGCLGCGGLVGQSRCLGPKDKCIKRELAF